MDSQCHGDARGWLEALAMKDGRRARDETLASALRDADVAAGRALEDEGRLTEAYRLYSSVIETFGDLTDVSAVRSKVSALDDDRRMADARKEEQRADRDERERACQLARTLGELRAEDLPMSMVLSSLRVETMKRDAQTTGYKALAAQRTLELIFVQTSFYVWRDFEDKRDYARAALCLEIAASIHPKSAACLVRPCRRPRGAPRPTFSGHRARPRDRRRLHRSCAARR